MSHGFSDWDLRLTESDVPEGPRCTFCGAPSTGTLEYGGGRFNPACDPCKERVADTVGAMVCEEHGPMVVDRDGWVVCLKCERAERSAEEAA